MLKRYLDAGMAFTAMTKSRAEGIVRELVKTGEVQRDQVQSQVDELIDRSRRNTEHLVALVRKEVSSQLAEFGTTIKGDLKSLERRLNEKLGGSPGAAPPATAPARKAPAKKAPAAAKKAPATKVAATNEPAAKAPAKRAPKKQGRPATVAAEPPAPDKKVPAKKVPAKKVPANEVPAKKVAAKRAPTKRAAAKEAATKKAAPGVVFDSSPPPAPSPAEATPYAGAEVDSIELTGGDAPSSTA